MSQFQRIWIVSVFLMTMAMAAGGREAYAQDSGGGSSRAHQAGFFVGRLLPNDIEGADEIFGLGGVRYSMPFGGGSGFADIGVLGGNGEGVKWQGAFLTVSMQVPVETLIAHAGVGADYTRYQSEEFREPKYAGGAHFVGGVLSQLGGNVLARFDMKLNSKPGSSLYFAIGLVFEFGGPGAAGGS